MNKREHEVVIMVAEDHTFQRKALLHQIRGLGYRQLLEARDGVEALALCQQQRVDILLCDLRMPGMDGMGLLRRLSQAGFRGGIILSSALEGDVVEAVLRMSAAYGLHVLGRLDKPARPGQLAQLIQSWSPAREPSRQEEGHRIDLDQLKRGIEQQQILPWYQPKVSFATGQWAGMEALARWQHPEYGLISPGLFIPMAEEHDLIAPLTEIIIGKSLSDAHLWGETGLSINLSMNLCASSLNDGSLCQTLIDQCRHWSVDPALITLEVTESAFIRDIGAMLEVLTRLRMHGFGLSIDDFGTGYSSMQQLALLPFTELKLDRSFVDRCHADPAHLAIIESSIELARKLGLKTVAEGVEDAATWHLLARLGCDLCQGFFSARPMPHSELASWHRTWQDRLPTLISI
ncbi:EAL domain-containing response regulator [Aeromonas allosaccharophila]|uniref:Transcriptional regulator n=2 Tax=Aeromonas TaxID=642 RepID=A0A6S5C5I5_AERVE|nr:MULTISPECIES: EAL domain-containing response regulator [Aeromonas]WOE67217.1 EAL domain-containing response regulator [Aeromonas allosaccharophila]BBR38245.1 transcriptional regulator [Aeromonas veronii]